MDSGKQRVSCKAHSIRRLCPACGLSVCNAPAPHTPGNKSVYADRRHHTCATPAACCARIHHSALDRIVNELAKPKIIRQGVMQTSATPCHATLRGEMTCVHGPLLTVQDNCRCIQWSSVARNPDFTHWTTDARSIETTQPEQALISLTVSLPTILIGIRTPSVLYGVRVPLIKISTQRVVNLTNRA